MVEAKKEKSEFDDGWRKHSGFLDYNAFIENIHSNKELIESQLSKRKDEQEILSSLVNKKAFLESKNCKKYVRIGVPLKYMKGFINRLLDINDSLEQYLILKDNVFIPGFTLDSSPDLFPLYTNKNSLKDSLPINYLTDEGTLALKEIMWILSSVYKDVEFSPLIVKLVMMLLVFLQTHEAYFVIRALIELDQAITDIGAIRWRLRFNLTDYRKLVYAIPHAITEISEKTGKIIASHFKKINFQLRILVEDMIYNFFLEYLDFETVATLVPLFFYEGAKVLYRFAFAIIKINTDKILKVTNPDQIVSEVKKFSRSNKNSKLLFEKAFQFELTAENNSFVNAIIDEEKLYLNFLRHIPIVEKDTFILNKAESYKLFSAFPNQLFKKIPRLLIRKSETENPNLDLTGLYAKVKEAKSANGILILIQIQEDEVLAVLFSGMLDSSESNENRACLLYNIRPIFRVFDSPKEGRKVTPSDIALWFGEGENGAALFFDSSLKKVFSFQPNSFGISIQNVHEVFSEIKQLEVFLL